MVDDHIALVDTEDNSVRDKDSSMKKPLSKIQMKMRQHTKENEEVKSRSQHNSEADMSVTKSFQLVTTRVSPMNAASI